MSEDTLGLRLIRAALQEETLKSIATAGVTSADLFDSAKIGYEWLLDFHQKYGTFPTVDAVNSAIGTALPDVAEPLDFIVEQVRKRALTLAVKERTKLVIERLDAKDPDGAAQEFSAAGTTLRAGKQRAGLLSMRDSGEERLKEYDEITKVKGLLGVPTPWPGINAKILGWVNGDLHVIAAIANTGKTWTLCIAAEYALANNYRVLFISLEMPSKRILRRVDALRYKIPFKGLRRGNLDPADLAKWEAAVRADATPNRNDLLLADKREVKYVDDVKALVEETEPDIVFIDGGYRFQVKGTKKSSGEWANTVDIVAALQTNAEISQIPWVVTTQMGDSTETGKKSGKGPRVRAWNVRYGKEWFINPDVLIGQYQDDDLRITKRTEYHVLKVRESDQEEFNSDCVLTQWDMGTMSFEEVITDTGGSAASGLLSILQDDFDNAGVSNVVAGDPSSSVPTSSGGPQASGDAGANGDSSAESTNEPESDGIPF